MKAEKNSKESQNGQVTPNLNVSLVLNTTNDFLTNTKSNSQLCFTMEVLLKWNMVTLSRDFRAFLDFLAFLAQNNAFELCLQLIKMRSEIDFPLEEASMAKMLQNWAKSSFPASISSEFPEDLAAELKQLKGSCEEMEEEIPKPKAKTQEEYIRDLKQFSGFYQKLKGFYAVCPFVPGTYYLISTKWLNQFKTAMQRQEVTRLPPINADENLIRFDLKGDLLPYVSNERYLANMNIKEDCVFPKDFMLLPPDLWNDLYEKYNGLESALTVSSCDHRSRIDAEISPILVINSFETQVVLICWE